MLTVAIVAGILLAAILGYAATKPGAFRVQRAKSIQAPPEKIFELINDFHHWASWSPYEKLDPTMKKTFSGAPSGRAPCTPGLAIVRRARGAWRLRPHLQVPRSPSNWIS